jgi:hypothetical protein
MSPEIEPFGATARLIRDLRDAFVAELDGIERTDYANTLLGNLAALITNCRHADEKVNTLRTRDRLAYEAFCRAMSRVGVEEMEANEEQPSQ